MSEPLPAGSSEYDGLAHNYDRLLEPVLHHIRLRTTRWLAEHDVRRALDVGCGTGKQVSLAPAGVDVVGIDLSTAMLRVAETQAPGRCQQGDATQLPFPDASFDVVYTQFALHEKREEVIDGLLSEARRVLRPGGHLLVVDYAVGPHRSLLCALAHPTVVWVERFAGDQHYANYRAWMARGGLDRVVPAAGFTEVEAVRFWGGPIKLGVFTPEPTDAPRAR